MDLMSPHVSNCFHHRGKGFLAADESAGPWLRARHAEAAKIPDAGSVDFTETTIDNYS